MSEGPSRPRLAAGVGRAVAGPVVPRGRSRCCRGPGRYLLNVVGVGDAAGGNAAIVVSRNIVLLASVEMGADLSRNRGDSDPGNDPVEVARCSSTAWSGVVVHGGRRWSRDSGAGGVARVPSERLHAV